MAFVIVSSNINANMTPAARKKALSVIKRSAGRRAIIGWQEIMDPSHLATVQGVFAKTNTHPNAKRTRNGGGNPVSYRGLTPVKGFKWRWLHAGLAHATIPQFICTTVMRTSIKRKFAFSNRHYVPGAFKFNASPAKIKLYNAGLDNDVAYIKECIKEGLPVAAVGDYNYYANKPYGDTIAGRKVRYIRNGLDFICLIDGSTHRWKVQRKWTLNVGSDHRALFVKVGLVK